MMADDRAGYRAYLLRLWRITEATWRASLEDPHTGERRAFATLEQLVAFLEQALDSRPAHPSIRIPPTSADSPLPGIEQKGNRAGGVHSSSDQREFGG